MLVKEMGNNVEIQLDNSSIGYIVRGKMGPRHTPSLLAQHADCILSTGEPVGFFGREGPGSGGISSVCWNSVQMNKIANAIGYDQMLDNAKALVDAEFAREMKIFSTIIIIRGLQDVKCLNFDDFWWKQKDAKRGSLPPFHLLGRNCSSFAHLSFEEIELLNSDTRTLLLTPDKLFNLLVEYSNSKKFKLDCYSGFLGFKPHEEKRRLRSSNKNSKYNIIIKNFSKHVV